MCKIMLTLKAARINVNLTQNQAAKLLNVSNDIISNWEEEKRCQTLNRLERSSTYIKFHMKILFFCLNNTVLPYKERREVIRNDGRESKTVL